MHEQRTLEALTHIEHLIENTILEDEGITGLQLLGILCVIAGIIMLFIFFISVPASFV